MKTVGLVGWRGMVGSVLLQRMKEEQDFNLIKTLFFSTSHPGNLAQPVAEKPAENLLDANDLSALAQCDVIVTCQGGDYSRATYEPLRQTGWKGYWIDAASTLRMHKDATLILDPVNLSLLKQSLSVGNKLFVGANCTVSLMLMALAGLFKENLIEWVSAMTYQAASGAGARHMAELLAQMGELYGSARDYICLGQSNILEMDAKVNAAMFKDNMPVEHFGKPLAGSLLPWIDEDLGNGQSREEKKASDETNKILGLTANNSVKIDGLCVRIGAMRCHSQALTIKLKENLPLDLVEEKLRNAGHDWLDYIPNTRVDSLEKLTPVAVSGQLKIAIGRVRKLSFGNSFYSAFTVGDQLLWGAAEPLRRMLRLIISQ